MRSIDQAVPAADHLDYVLDVAALLRLPDVAGRLRGDHGVHVEGGATLGELEAFAVTAGCQYGLISWLVSLASEMVRVGSCHCVGHDVDGVAGD